MIYHLILLVILKNGIYYGIQYNKNAEEILTAEEVKILEYTINEFDYI